MASDTDPAVQIQHVTGLAPKHFADLIRAAQIVYAPSGCLSGRMVEVAWEYFGIQQSVVENLQTLGRQYQYASPYVPMAVVWEQLTPETRSWFIENKDELWRMEEFFPAYDED